ncbi:hypothetical protein KC319_g50 [Hortaea werneckii]|nr:hypothetical protein KC319_g50 [Hortaea werneckii]
MSRVALLQPRCPHHDIVTGHVNDVQADSLVVLDPVSLDKAGRYKISAGSGIDHSSCSVSIDNVFSTEYRCF